MAKKDTIADQALAASEAPTADEVLAAASLTGMGGNTAAPKKVSEDDILVKCIRGEGEIMQMGQRTYTMNPKAKPFYMAKSHASEASLVVPPWVIPLLGT